MTATDVKARADIVRANLELLDRLPHADYAAFAADFRNLQSALHLLQTAIQALIDVGAYVLAARGLPAPRSSRAILEVLAERGVLPPDAASRFGPILAFRNRVVHLYDRIDPEMVFDILVEERRDLHDLLALLLDALPEE